MRHETLLLTAIITVILVFCAGSYRYINLSAEQLNRQLPLINQAIEDENWPQAGRLFATCNADWQDISQIWFTLIDHQDMRDIEISFTDMQALINLQNKERALREMANLSYYINQINDGEQLSLQNIL